MARRRERAPLNAEINVVSLIDVMMLLMVIFMITAPIMQGGVNVALPKAEAKPLEPKSGLIVTVNHEGKIFVDETELTYGEFKASFAALAESRERRRVSSRGSGRAVRCRRATVGRDAQYWRAEYWIGGRAGGCEVSE